MFEFMIRRVLAGHNLDTVEGRVAALRASAPVVAGIRDQALNVGYVRNLAGWLGMDPEEVTRAVRAVRARTPKAAVANASVMRRSHITCHAAALSWILGRKLTIDPVKEEFVNDDEANSLRTRPARDPWKI